ncbi:MAG: response regulator [Chloracidobacterium sp.]|nr:response regulator [Chloracidobacterium sp.]
MDREKLQKFVSSAAADLASVRSSLLIAGQGGEADLAASARCLEHLKTEAFTNMQPALAVMAADCATASAVVARGDTSGLAIGRTLDLVAAMEAALLSIPIGSADFIADVGQFVESSFDSLLPETSETQPSPAPPEAFDIDDETLDVFRDEAGDLLASIDTNLRTLANAPGSRAALWEIRRSSHTFKGAAGIVGLTNAAAVAHQMEDLLDKMVELQRDATPEVMEFLNGAAVRLNSIVRFGEASNDAADESYARALACLDLPDDRSAEPVNTDFTSSKPLPESVHTPAGPVVRVSLERLDDLLRICNGLLVNRSALVERFAELNLNGRAEKVNELFEVGRRLTGELKDKLTQIRMVKFSTLETRLARAVNVTCTDEAKKASLEIENGEVEIDTRHIDALIEPLLHLLKNAVVHGIERPETRRLIGKPEKGAVRVRIDANEAAIILTVADDGAGIPLARLREKAASIGRDPLDDDSEALKLIFERGLTTAEKLDLNAGRGVGLSIVKESVESRGGSVMVDSKPQVGTTFTILLPLHSARPEPEPNEPADEAPVSDIIDTTPLVLVVDDSSTIRSQLARLIEQAGFRVITANNGADALELLLNNKEPDLILSDIEMPQIDGWQFLEYVKTDDNFGRIPVVMVTSLDADEHRERAFSLGASDYIVKPFGTRDVERALSIIKAPVAA